MGHISGQYLNELSEHAENVPSFRDVYKILRNCTVYVMAKLKQKSHEGERSPPQRKLGKIATYMF